MSTHISLKLKAMSLRTMDHAMRTILVSASFLTDLVHIARRNLGRKPCLLQRSSCAVSPGLPLVIYVCCEQISQLATVCVFCALPLAESCTADRMCTSPVPTRCTETTPSLVDARPACSAGHCRLCTHLQASDCLVRSLMAERYQGAQARVAVRRTFCSFKACNATCSPSATHPATLLATPSTIPHAQTLGQGLSS
jgi:hypothetical protein